MGHFPGSPTQTHMSSQLVPFPMHGVICWNADEVELWSIAIPGPGALGWLPYEVLGPHMVHSCCQRKACSCSHLRLAGG